MQLTTILLPLFTLLPTLISASACVAGGPAASVSLAGACCKAQGGTWYQFYPNQAICVVSDARLAYYNACVSRTASADLDTRCIPGDGTGLSTVIGSTTYTGPRETITPA